MVKFRFIFYFDVWGNKKDGWEVNNLCEEAILDLPEYPSVKDIVKGLKKAKFFLPYVRSNMIDVNDYGMGDMLEITRKNGFPLGRLELIREEA